MRIHLKEIPENGLTLEFEENVKHYPIFTEMKEFKFLDPLTVELQLRRADQSIEMKGRLKTRGIMTCSRCLKPFVQPLKSDFRLIYANRPQSIYHTRETELSAEDVELILFDGEIIDTYQAIYEETLAALPSKPLCHPDCKGLCPRCGKDLNRGACQCKNEEVDPRLAVLKQFKVVKNR
jgi:uncharacterized protein